ncbi:Mss4-like protein [Rhodocollybia butyracea]|uniref:Mss4-like protein n=1 Tax=Rhodocollybia butyracea TaxID=206335 RepID=A0A9P5U6U1_9AGAR|nr:Mss4-like protein [Rhodocollybia butyracea]
MTTYSGNCHCGLIKYTITLPGSIYEQTITSCNCSWCARQAALFIYFPKKEAKYFSGEDDRKSYNATLDPARAFKHKFCPQCGSYMGWQSTEPQPAAFLPGFEGINVRMLNDIDFSKLKLKLEDTRSKYGEYEVGKWYEEKEKEGT